MKNGTQSRNLSRHGRNYERERNPSNHRSRHGSRSNQRLDGGNETDQNRHRHQSQRNDSHNQASHQDLKKQTAGMTQGTTGTDQKAKTEVEESRLLKRR